MCGFEPGESKGWGNDCPPKGRNASRVIRGNPILTEENGCNFTDLWYNIQKYVMLTGVAEIQEVIFMADYKQYITQIQENGNVMISENVIAAIVAYSLAEVEGIGSLGVKPGIGIADFDVKKHWGKSLKVNIAEDNNLSIDCSLMVRYGYSVVDVAAAVQQAVTTNVESTTGVKVTEVNVHVCGIVH